MTKPYPTEDLCRYRLTPDGNAFSGFIFWGRVVSSERESLLTQYTKHTFFEIQYALEGHIVMTVGDRAGLRVGEGELVVIPPDTYHQIVDADSTGARFIMAFSAKGKSDGVRAALKELLTPRPVRETAVLRALLGALLETGAQNAPFCREELTSLTESFLLELLQIFTPHRPLAASPAHAFGREGLVEAVTAYIKERNGVGISGAEVALHFGFSERHLNRLFRTYADKSVHQVIAFEKLHHIETLISATELSFGEIAELCGFCDAYAMNKFFKRCTRLRLSDYRRLCRKEKQ